MEKDIIKQSFKELQEAEPVNEGGFIIEPMNKCIDEAHKLPPLISLYPEVVLEAWSLYHLRAVRYRQDDLRYADSPLYRRKW